MSLLNNVNAPDALPLLHRVGQEIKNGKIFLAEETKALLATANNLHLSYEVQKTILIQHYKNQLNQELDEITAIQSIIYNVKDLLENQSQACIT